VRFLPQTAGFSVTLARLIVLQGRRPDAAAAVASNTAPALAGDPVAVGEAIELCTKALETLEIAAPISLAMGNAHRLMADIFTQQADIANAKVCRDGRSSLSCHKCID